MKRALILCSLDGYANSVKPKKLKEFLERSGYEVTLQETTKLSRFGTGKLGSYVPSFHVLGFKLYLLETLHLFAYFQSSKRVRKTLLSFAWQKILETRAVLLQRAIPKNYYDILICENNYDEGIVLDRVAKIQILDLPTPFAEELLYGDEISEKSYRKLSAYECVVYGKADYVSFHWYSYSAFVRENKYKGTNFLDLGYGIDARKKKARFSANPKIVFLGYLGGYWSNPEMLEELTKLYPGIDVYGGPEVPGLKVNFKGYTKTSDVLADYQFGLVTITDDQLRRIGFSAKHLDYLSYGLPVLTPEWRKDFVLEAGSIYFTVENFLSQIKEYSSKEKWEEKSKAALNIAHTLNWDKVLQPLQTVLDTQNN